MGSTTSSPICSRIGSHWVVSPEVLLGRPLPGLDAGDWSLYLPPGVGNLQEMIQYLGCDIDMVWMYKLIPDANTPFPGMCNACRGLNRQ